MNRAPAPAPVLPDLEKIRGAMWQVTNNLHRVAENFLQVSRSAAQMAATFDHLQTKQRQL